MLGDGVKSYENDKDGSTTELAGCEVRSIATFTLRPRELIYTCVLLPTQANFRAKPFPTKARFTYYKNNYMQLDVMWRSEDEWEQCFKVRETKE